MCKQRSQLASDLPNEDGERKKAQCDWKSASVVETAIKTRLDLG